MKDFFPYSADSGGGRLKDGALTLFCLLLLPLYPLFWIVYKLRRRYSLVVRGFWVSRMGRDNIEYEERRNGKIKRLTIYGEMMAMGPHAVYVPNDLSWRREAPEWAQDRREEIIERIKSMLGSKKYQYVP
jgi:hypothetical protein